MKNLLKSALVLVFMLFTQQASAICYTNVRDIPQGGFPLFPSSNSSALCTSVAEANSGVRIPGVPLVTAQVVAFAQMPSTHVYRDCTVAESLVRDSLMLFKGAIVGALIGGTDRAAGVGGGLGLLFSTTGACRVAVPRTVLANQGVQGGQTTGVTTSGVACSTGGETFLVNSTEQCARMAMKIAAAATPAPTTGTVNVPVNTPDGKIGCNVDTGNEKFRFNAVNGRKFDREQCDRYLLKLDPLPKKEEMSLL